MRNTISQSPVILHGYTSREKAYIVTDLHGTTSYWIEFKNPNGFRMCSEKVDSKTGRRSRIKCSTHDHIDGVLFLDDRREVKWLGLGDYSDFIYTLMYITAYGSTEAIIRWCEGKIDYYEKLVSGKTRWVATVNGVEHCPSPESVELDKERNKRELEGWRATLDQAKKNRRVFMGHDSLKSYVADYKVAVKGDDEILKAYLRSAIELETKTHGLDESEVAREIECES